MDESLLSIILVFAELGGVLLIALFAWLIITLIKLRKEKQKINLLVEHIKSLIPHHQQQLNHHFNQISSDQKEVSANIKTLLDDEKKIYQDLLQAAIKKDVLLIQSVTDDINALINDYIRLLSNSSKESNSELALEVKKENKMLRAEVDSLTVRLRATTDTIENMLEEFAAMYEGGKAEGDKKVKNEIHQLKEKLDEEAAEVKARLREIEDEAVSGAETEQAPDPGKMSAQENQ